MRRPFCVPMHERGDCGPAALATVARHYGLHVSLTRARELVRSDSQGSDLRSLQCGAEDLGFQSCCGRVKLEAIDKIPLPAIAHMGEECDGHFVVVFQISGNGIVIGDPASGLLTLTRTEFLSQWTMHALLLTPAADFKPNKNVRSSLSELVRLAAHEKRTLFIASLLAAALTLSALAVSFSIQVILDRVIPTSNILLLYVVGAGLLLIALARSVGIFVRQYLLAQLGRKMEVDMGLVLMWKILSLPIKCFEKRAPGDLLTRISDITTVRRAAVDSFLCVFLDILCLLSSAAVLIYLNVSLGLLVLSFVPPLALAMWLIAPRLFRRQREVRDRLTDFANHFFETLINVRIVKAFTGEGPVLKRLQDKYTAAQDLILSATVIENALQALSTMLIGFSSMALLVIGTWLAIHDRLLIGELMFYYSVVGFFFSSLDNLSPSAATIQEALVSLERLGEINSLASESNKEQEQIENFRANGDIEFQNVSYSHRAGYPVLRKVSIKIEAGETVAVLGETGAGKSTLAGLISGLYIPEFGDLLFDGVSIRNINKASLRHNIAIVFQDGGLMSGTIDENIRFGSPQASPELVLRAAGVAQAHEFITRLPRAYSCNVGSQGAMLSSGQRQRIAIARAVLRNAPILILDEATSNLDPDTERAVMDGVLGERQHKTTLIITHRLNVALRANRLLIMSGGRIVESGQHRDLMQKGGKYQSMWKEVIKAQSSSEPAVFEHGSVNRSGCAPDEHTFNPQTERVTN